MDALTSVTVLLGRLLISILLAAVSLTACAGAPTFENLPPIADGASELRIRTNYFMPHAPGAATAYVVTPGELIVYSYIDGNWSSRAVRTPDADEILAMTLDLHDLNRRRIVCTFDGDFTQVEAAVGGRRFSFVIEAADGCSTGDGHRVGELLQRVTQAAAS